jgi:hypothetical protein
MYTCMSRGQSSGAFLRGAVERDEARVNSRLGAVPVSTTISNVFQPSALPPRYRPRLHPPLTRLRPMDLFKAA